MNRDFVGTGYGEPTRYSVHVEQDGMHSSLTHRLRRYGADYQWGGGGSDSADLARALLWVTTGVEPQWATYHLLATEMVSTWPRHSGECWRISEEQLRQWLAGVERDTSQAESPRQTRARLEQSLHRESKLRRFALTFRKAHAR